MGGRGLGRHRPPPAGAGRWAGAPWGAGRASQGAGWGQGEVTIWLCVSIVPAKVGEEERSVVGEADWRGEPAAGNCQLSTVDIHRKWKSGKIHDWY